MRIALDAMGGDKAPAETVAGAILAAREYAIEVVLVGQPDAINAELAKADTSGLSLPVEPAATVIPMDEHQPSTAWRRQRELLPLRGSATAGRPQSGRCGVGGQHRRGRFGRHFHSAPH